MKSKFVFIMCLLAPMIGRGDEVTRRAQTELKSLGFYYGEIDGAMSVETLSALKRYQIRNGLEVTGALDAQSKEALGLNGGAPAAEATQSAVGAEEKADAMPRPLPVPQKVQAPKLPVPQPSKEIDRAPTGGEYAEIFARTPFATAPRKEQENTVRNAQALLARSGLYREPPTGRPSPELEEAIRSYQRHSRLSLTGRLDLETLSQMQLLPGKKAVPIKPFYGEPRRHSEEPARTGRPSSRTYRGIWVE